MKLIRTGSVYLDEHYHIIEYIDGTYLVTNLKEFNAYFLSFDNLIDWIEDHNIDAVIEWSRYNADLDDVTVKTTTIMRILQ